MNYADIHCHVLPGVDDGSKSVEETRAMLRCAYKEGIRVILATPHYHAEMDDRRIQKRKDAFYQVKQIAAEISPNLQIFLGGELYYESQIVEELKAGRAPTMNNSHYVLVEFPTYVDFTYIRTAIQKLRWQGYWPILAHVERYDGIGQKPERVRELIQTGARIQTNADAVLGKQGWTTKRYLKKLIKGGLIHVIATDAHGSEHRRMQIAKCADYITSKFGREVCEQLCSRNPQMIIRGEKISEESDY